MFWRVAIKPGRPVAMGVLPGSTAGAGAAFIGLPGNPVAGVRDVCPRGAAVAAAARRASPEPLNAWPGALAFSYKKKKGRREYVRVALRPGANGVIEAFKHPQRAPASSPR